MSTLFEEVESTEAELHFSPSVILAIFLGITLVSAIFFGLGYSFGRTGSPAQLQHSLLSFEQTPSAPTISVTPLTPASSAAQIPITITKAAPVAVAAQTPEISTLPSDSLASTAIGAAETSAAPSKHSASHSRYMVQIAAIASRKDAKTLAAALQQNGLSAQVHSGSHDRFFHVQIGPFDSQQQAEAMRRKVIAAGYRAILKPA